MRSSTFVAACLLGIIGLLTLTACGDARVVPGAGEAGKGTLAINLASLGGYLLWIGAIAGSVGLALELLGHLGFASLIAGGVSGLILKVAAPFAPYLASIGICTFGVGCACLYLSDHPWIILLALVASAVAVCYVHRDDLRNLLVGRKAPNAPNTVNEAKP